jgi:ABC-type transport system involved in multi-copper enzyme maturation permease subunit
VSFFLSALDGTSLVGLLFLGNLLNKPDLINLYLFTPSYNLSNLTSWFENGTAFLVGPSFTASPSVGVSVAILLAWMIGLIGSAIVIFQRQDITS